MQAAFQPSYPCLLPLAILSATVVGCQGSGTSGKAEAQATSAVQHDCAACAESVAAGARWLTETPSNDPYRWIYLDALGRRFGLREAEGALAHYRAAAAVSVYPDVGLFLRFADPSATATGEQLAAVPWERNRGLLTALHCDQLGWPPEYASFAKGRAAEGGYPLTHVLFDMILSQDVGCAYPLSVQEQTGVVEAVARLRTADPVIGDLEMEALWLLAVWGRRDLVPGDTVDRVLKARWKSGAWAFDGRTRQADAHATYIAMSLLLELTATPRGPLVAARPKPGLGR